MDGFIVITIAIAIGFCSLVGGVVYAGTVSTKQYYKAVNHCTDAGGMWIPNHDSGVCFRK